MDCYTCGEPMIRNNNMPGYFQCVNGHRSYIETGRDPSVICPQCGNAHLVNDKICSNCGLDWVSGVMDGSQLG